MVFYINVCKNVCWNIYACAGMGEVWEGMRGHDWGTCYGNRCVCSFIEGEVKAEARSCSCLEDLIYANNKRKEVKSRNWTRATVTWLLQSATRESNCAYYWYLYQQDATVILPFFSSFPIQWFILVTQTKYAQCKVNLWLFFTRSNLVSHADKSQIHLNKKKSVRSQSSLT